MTEWPKLQASVSSALQQKQSVLPKGLASLSGGVLPKKRFDVYRNNVALSLITVLSDTFPVVEKIVGTDFFATMAREFSLNHLPQSPVLINYGADFPEFLRSFQPVEHLEYLHDVAKLEWARNCAYHEADGQSVSIDSLASFAEADVPNLIFTLHPTLTLINSSWPIVTIWQAHQNHDDEQQGFEKLLLEASEAVLIIRPELDVLVQKISQGTHDFINAIAKGHSFILSVEQAIALEPSFDIPANLAGLFNSGAVISAKLQTQKAEDSSAV